jgi:arylsulfatase A-like enzyme
MDGLAAECVRFTRCVSNAGYTPLSHATLFTGCHAHRHGVVNFHNTTCRTDVPTLSERFSSLGYRTMLLTSKPRQTLFCDANQTLRHVDERFDDDDAFLAALNDRRDERVFAVIHVCDVHDPLVRGGEPQGDGESTRDWELFLRLVYNATPVDGDEPMVLLDTGETVSYARLQALAPGRSQEEILAHLRRLYHAYLYTVGKFDRLRFARLIDGLRGAGTWDQTLFALISDHGESQFWAYPWRLSHGALADETIVRVPMMIKLPGVKPKQIDHLAGLVDIAPTLLDAAGVDLDDSEFDGRSLLPTMQRNRPAGGEYWIEGWSHEPTDDHPHIICRAIRCADGRKYVWNGDAVDWSRLEALTPPAFAERVARLTYGNPPSDWLRGRIAELEGQHGRAGALRAVLSECRPRCLIFDNVDQDLTESNGIAVDESHPRWAEFEGYQQKMLKLTGKPNHAAPTSGEQQRGLEKHLRQMGYIA